MNRSKLIGATALASVMAASSAQAEMSISGLFAGTITDSDGGGMASGFSTNSVYVSYSDSMDNGGRCSFIVLTASGLLTDVNFDTGMGVIGLGNGQDSAADKLDGSPACFSLNVCGASEVAGGYNDGDALSGDSIMYTNSIAGWTVKVSRGEAVKSNPGTAGTAINNTDSTDIINVPLSYSTPGDYTRLTGTEPSEGHAA